jgi:hypothetical protein
MFKAFPYFAPVGMDDTRYIHGEGRPVNEENIPPAIEVKWDFPRNLKWLDLSDTPTWAIPADISIRIPKLKVAIFDGCFFPIFPKELAECLNLETVSFVSNPIAWIPENVFPPRLRSLNLTSNDLTTLPTSIGNCQYLEQLKLTDNMLTKLPKSMFKCKKLALLRLAKNNFSTLPGWLFTLPELAFLTFSGNPCCPHFTTDNKKTRSFPHVLKISTRSLTFEDGELNDLGQGNSGVVGKAIWRGTPEVHGRTVAVKTFDAWDSNVLPVTGDGAPEDELHATLAAGSHPSLIPVHAYVHGVHPTSMHIPGGKRGRVLAIAMTPLSSSFKQLGARASKDASTFRDTYHPFTTLTLSDMMTILLGVADAALHLHDRGMSHGEIAVHKILYSTKRDHAILYDFGAATIYNPLAMPGIRKAMEKIEVLAFAHLLEDLICLAKRTPEVWKDNDPGQGSRNYLRWFEAIHKGCSDPVVRNRLTFEDIVMELRAMIDFDDGFVQDCLVGPRPEDGVPLLSRVSHGISSWSP